MNKRSKDTAAAVNQALRGAEARLYALEELRAAQIEALQTLAGQTAPTLITDFERKIWAAATAAAHNAAIKWLEI